MNESSYFLLNYGEFNHIERVKERERARGSYFCILVPCYNCVSYSLLKTTIVLHHFIPNVTRNQST